MINIQVTCDKKEEIEYAKRVKAFISGKLDELRDTFPPFLINEDIIIEEYNNEPK